MVAYSTKASAIDFSVGDCGRFNYCSWCLIAKQPDLGTSIIIAGSGFFAIFLAGISWRLLALLSGFGLSALPVLWMVMHDYQRTRVMTLLDPQSDPLGAGWNTIQAMTALGSGGMFGKGYAARTQAQLKFLP